jgi:SH3-like domain-containing protein
MRHRLNLPGRALRLPLLFLGLLALGLASLVRPSAAADSTSDLPVPRFVTLRSDKVNVRSGPGARYSIEWVFERRGMPVEVVAEYELWRKVRDIEGTEGWVHQNLLSSRRGVIVTGQVRVLKSDAREDAPEVARVEPEVIGQLLECRGPWCRVDIDGYRGWLKRGEIWGLLPGDNGQ